MKKLFITATISAALLALPAMALALVINSNGSFEIGTDPGVFLTLTAPDTADITGWSVDSGSVDYIGTYWQASDGVRSIDLNGLAPGAMSQTFATLVGATYVVNFDLSGNPDSLPADNPLFSPSLKDVKVSATGATPQDFTFDTSVMGNTRANMMWQHESYSFVATASNTTLSFASQIIGAFGPVLDNVAVTETAPPPPPVPTNKDQCKDGGWMNFVDTAGNHFKNQGDCVSFVATKGKNLAAGH